MNGDLSLPWGGELSEWCGLASAFAAYCTGIDGLSILVESLNDFIRQTEAIIATHLRQEQQQQQQEQLHEQPQQQTQHQQLSPDNSISAGVPVALHLAGEWTPVPVIAMYECEYCHVQHPSKSRCGSIHRHHLTTCKRYSRSFGYDLQADVCVEETVQSVVPAPPNTADSYLPEHTVAAEPAPILTLTSPTKATTDAEMFRCRFCLVENSSKKFCVSAHRDHLPTCERYSAQCRFDLASAQVERLQPSPPILTLMSPTKATADAEMFRCRFCLVQNSSKKFCFSTHRDHLPTCERYSQCRFDPASAQVERLQPSPMDKSATEIEKSTSIQLAVEAAGHRDPNTTADPPDTPSKSAPLSIGTPATGTSPSSARPAIMGAVSLARWQLKWRPKPSGKYMCGHCGVEHQSKAFCVSAHHGLIYRHASRRLFLLHFVDGVSDHL